MTIAQLELRRRLGLAPRADGPVLANVALAEAVAPNADVAVAHGLITVVLEPVEPT